MNVWSNFVMRCAFLFEKVYALIFWILRPFLIWLFVGSLVVCYKFLFDEVESVQRVGACYQLAGIFVSASILVKTEKYFDYPLLPRRFVFWCNKLVGLFVKGPSANGEVSFPLPTSSGRGFGEFVQYNGTLEERLSRIEREFCEFKVVVLNLHDENKVEIKSLSDELRKEVSLRSIKDDKLENVLRDNFVGAIPLAEFGLACLLVGSLFVSFPAIVLH